MFGMKLIATSLLLFGLISCSPNSANVDEGWKAERLPTSEEVIAYIRDHWEDDYGKRFARFSSRPNDNAELIEIGDVACDYYLVTPQCAFEVNAKFTDENPQRIPMVEQFGWDSDGHLTGVIVMYHSRRRP